MRLSNIINERSLMNLKFHKSSETSRLCDTRDIWPVVGVIIRLEPTAALSTSDICLLTGSWVVFPGRPPARAVCCRRSNSHTYVADVHAVLYWNSVIFEASLITNHIESDVSFYPLLMIASHDICFKIERTLWTILI